MHPSEAKAEKVLDLENGLQIWKTHIDALKEQDVNARVMDANTFNALVRNIGQDKRLETLPLCCINAEKGNRIEILSGHHRIRAARTANILEVYVLVISEPLTQDRIKAKQLSHNAIEGKDDPQTIKIIFDLIMDVNAQLEAAINPEEIGRILAGMELTPSMVIDVKPKIVQLLFLPYGFDQFEKVIEALRGADMVGLIDEKEYNRVRETIKRLGGIENIRSLTSVVQRMCEIVLENLDVLPTEGQEAKIGGQNAT